MPVLRVDSFDGLVPRTDPFAIADNQATTAKNTRLYSGQLRAWRAPTNVATPIAAAKTIYKLYDYAGNHTWLSWNTLVDVALSPIADTGDIRFYFTGQGTPKKSTYALAQGTPKPADWYEMGVPAPIAPPTLTPTTPGTGTDQTRAYVYTFVSQFGSVYEESAPSPPQSITIKPLGATVTVSLFDSPPVGDYNYTHIRIYRSVTGATTASYNFVAEIPIASTSYDDSLTVAQLGGVLETIGWRPPPNDMIGLINVGGNSGVMAGFFGNTICFSQPFYPHAWPVSYQLTVPWKIVGLAAFGSSVVVMTERYPYIISGGTPGSMSQEMVQILEPCVSKASILTTEEGVVYASPNGLIAIGPTGRGNTTTKLYKRDEWQALTPANFKAAVLQGRYVGFLVNTAIVLETGDIPALCTLDVSGPACVHVDSKDASVYYVNASNQIVQLDSSATLQAYAWQSKYWRLPQGTSWSCLRVHADYGAQSSTVKVYSDSSLVATITPASSEPIRLPAFRGMEMYFLIEGTLPIHSVTFATSVAELRQ